MLSTIFTGVQGQATIESSNVDVKLACANPTLSSNSGTASLLYLLLHIIIDHPDPPTLRCRAALKKSSGFRLKQLTGDTVTTSLSSFRTCAYANRRPDLG